ncbi:MAG: hypothetical protein FJW61_04135 [Actinobacteria bacterium]|nr:hypothetical protein [Actinomycetota bacterium]
MVRKKINSDTEATVLEESGRRCCICFGLYQDLGLKIGQIAHLDKNNANSMLDNLAFLCLEHHDMYDSKTSQSKNFTIKEVKKYRDDLKERIIVTKKSLKNISKNLTLKPEEYKEVEVCNAIIEILSEYRTINQYYPIAQKLSLPIKTVERILIDLIQEKQVRVDRIYGTTKKTFSLPDSYENLIIDAFITTLNTKIISDDRFLYKNQYEIDAIIKTKKDIFVVVVKKLRLLTSSDIKKIADRINNSRKEFNIEASAKSVLLLGVDDKVKKISKSITNVESLGIIIKYVEIKK